MELRVLGPLQVRQDGATVTIPGAKPRAILTMLGLHNGSVVSADTLIALLWGDDPPRTAAKALQTHISSLRRALGDGVVVTEGTGWTLQGPWVDASRYKLAAKMGRDAAAAGDTSQAVARFEEALALWRGIPELPDGRRGTSEKTRWIEGHAALVEDRADALLATGRAAEIIGELEAAVADAPLRERRWGQLMLALYRAGRQGEALGAYQRARALLADELGVDPGPDLRRLEAAIVAQDAALETPAVQHVPALTRAVTFLLTDIEGSTAAWEADADAMAVALARHDELVEQVVTSRGGRLIKTRGEGDATFSVFERPSAAAAAAIELQEAISGEPWVLREPMRIRVALHTGEVEFRDGDYFGRAVNRAARLRSLAAGGQILCSGATAELVIDSLPDDVVLADLGTRELRNLARPERVFELRLETADDRPQPVSTDAPLERPILPAVLAGPGPFVGRGRELEQLFSAWQTALTGATNAVLIAGEPGVGKTRLAGEWSRQAYDQGALVIYGRCDEDLGAPYQPFAEALRALVPCLGTNRLRGLRGVEALLTLVPGLIDVLPDLAPPTRADPDTERYALFDAVVALLGVASTSAPVVLILDDLHWAAKPTLLLLRHLLRFGEQARVQIIGTYRSTDLDRSHPLAAMLADLHRSAGSGTASRIQLSGLDENDVTAYVAEAGYDDEELARALASVTGGNPFFLIEALRHVDESGGRWDQSTLPQGVREAVSRRLSRLEPETNKALAAAAVVGSRFALELVERVVGDDLVDAFDEACKAGIVIEEAGGRYRFNHAIVRQSLLAELASVRRMRLHQRIAATLENEPGADDELLAELAHHYFECAWAGNAAKAVEYCRRAADQAMARLAYEGAADLYDRALHALEEFDEELPDRDDQAAELLVARCEALLAAGDVASATGAVSQLQGTTVDSARLAAWATCFDGQLSMLIHPERLDDVEAALGTAAEKLAELDDAAGEAKAHTVRAGCLARLGRIGDCEIALDDALTAARRAREHRRVNAVLANAPLAALWGPNPVPRAGGRCLDVVRLLRITTDSPAVEATSTRCQAVLEAFRGRGAAARRMIDSARRTVTELGLRHALLEVEQFAGIVELVVDDPAAAEGHLRQAYNGFRRMGLDADTAETAALLGRTCLALGRDAEADELCTESERLAGHALKASIAWRTLRAQLLSRGNAHDEARLVAEAAVSRAERTDALVDHGDACLALARVLGAGGDVAGARAAAERAVGLYERKGAAALAENARRILGAADLPQPPQPEAAPVELTNACVQAGSRLIDAVNREAWDEVKQLLAPYVSVESRRKIVGFPRIDVPSSEWPQDMRRYLETGMVRYRHTALAVRGERLALTRLEIGTADLSSGAPQDEMLHVAGIDEEGRIALQVWFDVEDTDAALAELDAAHARFEEPRHRAPLENAATRADDRFNELFAERRWDEIGALLADDVRVDDRRRGRRRDGNDRATELAELRTIAALGTKTMTSDVLAIRGECLALVRTRYSGTDQGPEAFHTVILRIVEIDANERIAGYVAFDADDFEAAIAELDARYVAGEAAAHAHTWSVITRAYSALNRHEMPSTTPDWANVDHRHGMSFAPGELPALLASWYLAPHVSGSIEVVHRLDNLGAVVTSASHETSQEGVNAEWRVISVLTIDGDQIDRLEVFDEADIDAAIARFGQLTRPARRLENAACRTYERMQACFAARDWVALADTLVDDVYNEDRRRVVNAGVQRGRDAAIDNVRRAADLGVTHATSNVVATRGEQLVLTHARFSQGDETPGAFGVDVLQLVEVDADERIAALIMFDAEDFEAAIAELDAQYLAGEAAPYARTWSAIARAYATITGGELAATTPDWVNIDHRRAAAFAPGDANAFIRAAWDLTPDFKTYVEAVHRLNNLGAVVTHAARWTSQEGFDAEWRAANIFTVDGDRISRCELFDEADVDAVIARFDQLSRPATRLENAASQAVERYSAHFAARDWDALAKVLADDISIDDRRRVVNAGIRHGRDAEIANLRATADAGFMYITPVVIAARGERLILAHASGRDRGSEEFLSDALGVLEINSHNQIAAIVVFDLDDFESAITELDARYLAGEAAAHAHTWSVITRGHAVVNRRELPPTTPDCVSIDHRRGAAFAPGELIAYFRAGFDLDQDIRTYVEEVHRLSDVGAVCTHAGHGISRDGFAAEWRGIDLLTVEGDMVNRCEVFDEADLDVALARFEELDQQARRLKNAASQVSERFLAHFAAGDWDAMAELLADNYSVDDRRRVVGAGVRHGRDAQIVDMRAIAEVWITNVTSTVIAIRGERLVLMRIRHWDSDQRPEAFHTDALVVGEINDHERIVAAISFDPDDIDAAFEELDARYLAGEAAAHAHTWSVIAGAYAAINRYELPSTTADWVNIDHRPLQGSETSDLTAYIRATWDVKLHSRVYIEAVHCLSDAGAVVTYAAHGTSQEGFNAEWRAINISMVDGDLIDRSELFDDTDLDAALARFEELHPQTRRPENAATLVTERFLAHFAAGDWDAMPEMMADNFSSDDRRRVVGAGVRYGRNAQIMDMRTIADLGITNWATTHIATRGGRLALSRTRMSLRGQRPEAFYGEMLDVLEINADAQVVAYVLFDLDDIDAAFEELDARYLAGEAAAHAHIWSVITRTYAAMNRHELPATTPDWVNIDHRRGIAFAPGDATAYLRASQDPQGSVYIETVHRLSNLGAVFTWAGHGTSQGGFEAEWRGINVVTVEGDLINRGEIFDEADIDAAIARFEELHPQARRLENAASHVAEHFLAYFAAGDWDAMAEILADNSFRDDRRPVVGAGVRHGRDGQIADMRAIADLGTRYLTPTVLATRGERLVLGHLRLSLRDQGPEGFRTDVLVIGEINADGQIVAAVSFDLDDTDAAFEELDTRYLAGEAAPYARVWQLGMQTIGELNRHEPGPMIGRFVYADHRRIPFASGEEFGRGVEELWALVPDARYRTKAVHALDAHGTVTTLVIEGTDTHGSELQWGRIILFASEEPRVEVYEEEDLDAALARFEELRPQSRRLENAATQVDQRFWTHFAVRDWDAMEELLADDISTEDRRRVVNAGVRHGRDDHIAEMRAVAEVGAERIASIVMATRGTRLALIRICGSTRGMGAGEISAEVLNIVEIDADNRIIERVGFDVDDIDAAFEELDARYLAGEAAAHAHTWSAIANANAAFNRHEMPPTTPDWVNIDHRPVTAFAPGDMTAYIRATWDVAPDVRNRIVAVHRLSDLGTVFTQMPRATSQEGFEAEWREIVVATVEGDSLSRCEIFDEAEFDAALARFDELHPQARRLENAATQVAERLRANFAARDWTARAELLADDCSVDDRRRVVNAGNQHGRDADIANMRAIAALGVVNIALTVIATRGERLALSRARMSGRDQRPEAFYTETLTILEIDTNNRAAAQVVFDPDDIDAALAELDARYLAGEAAPHAHTWSLVTRAYAAFNRRELPSTTPDSVYIDHRPLQTLGAVDLVTATRSIWDIAPDLSLCIEAVHRLGELGAVVTQTLKGTSQEGFDAEWRTIDIFAFEGDLLSRCEVYDEADLDAVLARFEELRPQARRLENKASQVAERFNASFADRDWDTIAEMLTDDTSTDDRRPLMGVGMRCGRDTVIADWRATADVGVKNIPSAVIATRGERLVLSRYRFSGRDQRPEAFRTDVLGVLEIDSHQRIMGCVMLDLDDIDAAFEELDARYLAGEAASHAHAWSVIAGSCAAFNRHELPAADWVTIDHRPLAPIDASDLPAAMRAIWDLTPDLTTHIEAVHRLSNFGAIVTITANGTSPEGFDAEWRMIDLFTVEGDRFNRCEMFDEADLDAALARFEELRPPARRLENAASRLIERFLAYFAARNWAAIAEMSADEISTDDRRSVVSSGILRGRDIDLANIRATADVGVTDLTSTVIATRGERLALARIRLSGRDQRPEAFHTDLLNIVEIDTDSRFAARILFDLDDIDAAFEELDARYLAGEAAAHSRTWSVITGIYAAFNRHELSPTTPDWVNTDHRRGIAFAPGDMTAYVRAGRDLTPDNRLYIETVHRLSNLGAVVTHVMKATSRDGFDAEWREIGIVTVEDDLISRCEIFDEADLDAAITRFDELDRQAWLENAATRAWGRVTDAYNRRDLDGFLALGSAGVRFEDRRKGMRDVHHGPVRRKAVQAIFELAPSGWQMTVEPIAIRGPRLSLTRACYRDTDDADRPIAAELLHVTEVGDDDLMRVTVSFDPDDLNDAFAELTAQWIASGEVAHPEVIEVVGQLTEATNRHDWDAFATLSAGATYVNHRQLSSPGVQTIADHMSSILTMASLVPDFWVEQAEVLTQSAMGVVSHVVLRGTSTDGVAIEIPLVMLILLDGGRVTRFEAFDADQRDSALARFEELNRSG
ncbi:BTAD domain-containing putative transcriptional regulator [Mycobacterium sp.]|uniref:BTAD domain-containing putative transcriptional regulator n=1 Tax=Mycobacterium sp. TaxID=1785 RepID=UPI003F9CE053